jgi:cell division protein FtsI (penicillin-binding protein 3)
MDLAKQHADPEINEDAPSEPTGDLSALFAEVNNLPADDPLRTEVNGQQPAPSAANELASNADPTPPPPSHPAPRVAPVSVSAAAPAAEEKNPLPDTVAIAHPPPVAGHGIVVDAQSRIGVPSFLGEPLRVAIETASTAGLALQIVGSGIAREQVPAAGSMVPPGTEVVVRFTR